MVQAKGLATRILAYSAYADDAEIQGMLDAGAAGYVLKQEPPAKVIEAIRTVARGGKWFSQKVAARMAEWIYEPPGLSNELTEREEQVLRLLVKGVTDRESATELGITERTVRFHLQNIYSKLKVGRRTGAVAWAIRNGISEKKLREHLERYSTDSQRQHLLEMTG